MDQPNTYNLTTPPKEPETFSIGVDTDAPLSGNALDGRTFKYHIALGANSPGFDEIKKNLAAGQEDQYQKMLQDQEMASRQAVSRSLVNSSVQEGITDDPLLVASLADVGLPPEKSTVLEETYFKKAMDYITSQDTTEAMMKALDENPMGVDASYRAYEEIGIKNHITQKWADKVDQMVKNTGWVPYLGYFGLQMAQFPTWANITGNWKGGPESSSWTTGGAMEQKVAEIRQMDPVAMDKAIEAEVNALAALNPLDAQKFVEALRSFGSNDLAMNYVDDLSMLPVGTAAKLGKKGVEVAVLASKEAKAITEATEAGKARQATGVAEDAGKAATEAPWTDTPPVWGEGGFAYDAWNNWIQNPKTKVYGKEAEKLLSDASPAIEVDGKVYRSVRSSDHRNPEMHIDAVDEAKADGHSEETINKALENGGHGWVVDPGNGDPIFLRDDQLLPKKEGRSIFPKKEEAALKDPVEKEIEDTARAASAEGTDIPTALSGSGKPRAGMTWEVRKNLAEEQLPDAPGALQRNWATALKKLNSWASTKLKNNAGDNFYTGMTNDMEPLVRKFLDIVQQTTDVARVSRLPEEAMNKAFDMAEKVYMEHYSRIQDRLLDMQSVPSTERLLPGKTGLNVGILKLNFGKEGGQLFESIEGAQQAQRVYGLPAQDTVIRQSGSGYYLETYATVGEDRALDFILTPENLPQKNTWSVIRNWVGGSKTQTSKFQSHQRAAVAHAESHLGALIREVFQPYEKLGKRSRKALDDIMRHNQLEERIPGDPTTRGMYYKNGPELEEAFMKVKGRLPTKDESEAYFAVVRAADLDWMYRSWSQYRLKAVQGFQNVTVSRLVKEGNWGKNTFEGRVIDRSEFPIDSRHNIDVLYIGEDGMVAKINLAKASDAEMEALRKAQADNWKFIQPYQVRDPKVFKVSGDTDPIAFVVSKDVERSNLRLDNQVNYRPGFHNEYKSEYFVKQAKVKNGRHEGDVAALGFRTEAEAAKYGSRMEQARLLLIDGKLDELRQFLSKNLPMDLNTFQKMFDEHLDPYQPLAVTKSGERTTKLGSKLLNGKSFAEQYGNIDTTLDELYNPSNRGFGDPFVAQRDPVLWSIGQGGTEDNPVFQLKQADLLSPMLTQTKAMGKLIKSELYNDYQLTSAQHWIETFADNLTYKGAPVTRNQLRMNPLFYLKNADVSGTPNMVAQATQLRTAIQNLVGTPSKTAESLDHFKQKILSSIYERWGEKYLPTALTISEKLIPTVTDPVSHLRAIAFHSKLGLYNPVQFAVQAAALTNVVAISPVHGTRAIPAMIGARMLRLTEDEGIISKVAEHVASLGGWSKEQFADSYKLMRKTGFDHIGGETAWRNDMGDPTLFRSKMGRVFLDKGAMFFNEGERAVRVAAWNTAYLEHVSKNPKKVGKFNEYDIAAIRGRAQQLSGNMSRDANSWWQNNPATSVTTQFWSYNVRMGELMIGKQLTDAERARLMFSQGMLWGFTPAALIAYGVEQGDLTPALTSGAGLNPFAEDIQAYAANNGISMDGTAADAMYYGMVSKWFEMMTGDKFDFGSRYGMSSPQVIETLQRTMKNDGPYRAALVAATGPSGSVVNEIFKEASTVYSSMYDLVTGDNSGGALLATDISNAMSEVSSWNAWTRIRAAAFGASYRTQNGAMVATGEDPLHDMMSAVFGVEDAALGETFSISDAFNAQQKEIQDDQKQAMRYSAQLWDAKQRGDDQEVERLRGILRGYLAGTNLSPEQRLTLLYPTGDKMDQIEKVILQNIIDKSKGAQKENLIKEKQERYGN